MRMYIFGNRSDMTLFMLKSSQIHRLIMGFNRFFTA